VISTPTPRVRREGKPVSLFQIMPLNAKQNSGSASAPPLILLAHDHLPNRLHIHASEAAHWVFEITLNIK
jgi:hypothetical protein